MTLLQVFKQYADIAEELSTAVSEYSDCFTEIIERELKEQIFNEKVSLKEEADLEKRIEKLGIKFHNLYVKFLNYTNIVRAALKKELHSSENVVKALNKQHLKALMEYVEVIAIFDVLEDDNPDYDFKKVVNVSAMDHQKMLLNKAIDDFNFRLMSDSEYKLWTVDECITEVEGKYVRSIESRR